MTGYERIVNALGGNPVDKVPVMLHNFMMAAREAGYSMKDYRDSPRAIADSFINAVEKYKYDGVLVEIDTTIIAGACGVPVDFPEDEPARCPRGLIRGLEEVAGLPDVRVENYRYIQIILEAVRLLKDHFRDDIFIRGNCDQAPFTLSALIRGTQDFLTDLILADKDSIIRLLEYATSACLQFIRLMAQTGADMVSNGDSIAGPDVVPPEIYSEFAFPYEMKLVEEAHRLQLPYTLHICGDTTLILDQMVETGADAFELDYKTDVKNVTRAFKNGATLIGNIDPSGVIANGTVHEVRGKTNQLLEHMAGTNRFILNAGCAIPSNTPEDNIFALVQAARDFKPLH
ncbi:MAG: uroporphyrinogen decarboxylase family protein [Bacteroidales bacterium]|nr:uroporphyrinogen decarboxylase family protein [Bacteroidales bacterium]